VTGAEQAGLCGQAMAHMDEFIDDELPTVDVRERISAHLLACPGCRAEFDQEERLKQLVRRTCACDSVPDEVRARIEIRIAQLRVQLEHVTDERLGYEQVTLTAEWRRSGFDR
jgi:mycothiol system anti-sigma-R factor